MHTLLKDIHYAIRSLLKRPAFAVITIITLALGIGASTAIFSVVNALLFKPLPYPQPDRLMAVAFDNGKPQGYQFWSYPKYTALRDNQSSFETLAAYHQLPLTVMVGDQAKKVEAEIVTEDYFSLLGVRAVQGRPFTQEEGPLLLLGYRMWQEEFGGAQEIVGRSVEVNRQAFVVVGVMPPDFRGQSGAVECWVPMSMAGQLMYKSALTSQAAWWLKVLARLKPGVSQSQANAEMPMVSARVAELVPARTTSMLTRTGEELIKLVPLKDTKIDPAVRKSFLILLAVVGLALFITCANTANLLLARAVSRQKEFAVRLALGGARVRLMRLVLTESVLLGLVGGVGGILVATWSLKWLTTAKPWNTVGFWSQYAQTFDYFEVKLDWSLFGFNFLLAFLAGILFGLVPAWRATRPQINELLKQEGSGSLSGFGSWRRLSSASALVIVEIALSVVLLTGAGLMVKSFARLSTVKLGFEPQAVVTMTLEGGRHSPEFYQNLAERVRALPGVERASLSMTTPLSGIHSGGDVEIEGRPQEAQRNRADFNVVTPEYFDTFRIVVLKGRGFTAQDRRGAPRVAVITREMAERYWPGENPIGRRIKIPFRSIDGDPDAWTEIVGVVDDVKYGGVEEPAEPTLYLPSLQPLGTPQAVALAPDSISIRAASETGALITSVRREVQALDRSTPLHDITTMQERVGKVTSRYRYSASLVGAFAGMALLLSALGIYSVMAYAVSGRTRELGIRMALGARRQEILQLVMGQGLFLILTGLALGVLGGFLATRVLSSQLYEVSSSDPSTFLIVTVVMTAVALFACYLPARRATKVDPLVALRYE